MKLLKKFVFAAAVSAVAPAIMALDSAPQTPSQAEPAVAKTAVNVNAPAADAAQIAVYDSVEKSWRRPTPTEQAELSQGASGSGEQRTFTLPNGGVVVEVGADAMSFLTVELQPDGTMKMDHVAGAEATSVANAPTPRLKKAASTMGGRDE